MAVHKLLSRLEKVRQERQGQWVACCPAHQDKSPSLAIGESDDGRVLVHCHGGCSALDVITSVGLEWSDLFPDTDKNHRSLMQHMMKKPTVDDYVVDYAQASSQLSREDKERYALALMRGGKPCGIVDEITTEVLIGRCDAMLKEMGL